MQNVSRKRIMENQEAVMPGIVGERIYAICCDPVIVWKETITQAPKISYHS